MRRSRRASTGPIARSRPVKAPSRAIRSVTSLTRWASTRYVGMPRRLSWAKVSSLLPSVVALKPDDRHEVGIDHAAHARPLACRRRVVAEVGHADQPLLGAERVEDLGDARDERDDARGRRRERHLATEHVARRERGGGRGDRKEDPDGEGGRSHARDPAHAATKARGSSGFEAKWRWM